MQTTYGAGRRKSGRRQTGRSSRRDSRQLVQLLVCLVVFLTVYIGKGIWPSHVAQTGEQLLYVIRANTDFRGAFADLGQALSGQESVLGEIGDFCVNVFAPQSQQMVSDNPAPAVSSQAEPPTEPLTEEQPQKVPQEETLQQEPALQVGDVVQETQPMEDLPEGYSSQWLYLGGMETATPVAGTVTSAFGYRDHPTIGRYAPHGGVDIAADRGTAIAAFADGTVANVGRSEDFGLHLQIDHANGVSTFYSHCDRILVQKGDSVQAGQRVAQVGSTGQSTGPHLHFEVRLNGVRLDPAYYIEPGQEG